VGLVSVGEGEGDGDAVPLIGCDADAPLPAAMKLPPSMVAVALSGMRTVPGNHSRGRRRTAGWRFQWRRTRRHLSSRYRRPN
jgi:hypothetical protein